jgi:hypothetical protein
MSSWVNTFNAISYYSDDINAGETDMDLMPNTIWALATENATPQRVLNDL